MSLLNSGYQMSASGSDGISNNSGAGSSEYPFSDSIGAFVNRISGTSANNEFNRLEAQKQRDFEEMMSSTAYQRAAKDMKAAGINPATLTGLAGGSAASTPSASSASSGSGNNIVGMLASVVLGSLLGKRGSQVSQRRVDIYHHR